MFELDQKTTIDDSSLSDDLLQLYNEFVEFNDYNAFFCDACAGVVSNDDLLDTSTIHGIHRCSRWMKSHMEEFKARLKALERKSRTANHSSR